MKVRWKDRNTASGGTPDKEEVLLGAYPLEGMDLMVHPKRQELTGVHGDKVRNVVKEPVKFRL